MSKRESKRKQAWPTSFTSSLLILGVTTVALGVWGLSLSRENADLRAQLAEAGIDVDGSSEPAEPAEHPAETGPAPGPEAPSAEPVAPAEPGAPRELTAGQRQLMLERLRNVDDSADKRLWVASAFGDDEAEHFRGEIASVFIEAGWEVSREDFVRFPIRPGIYFMMADEEPPPHVLAAQAAVELAFPDMTSGRGYRAFYQERVGEDPGWRGFPMTDDQTFVLAVGRAGS